MGTCRNVAIYARVSTSDQNPQLQLDALRQLAVQRGWKIVSEYVDQISGSKDRRPQLDRLMRDAHKGKLDIVICWRFDRFARSVRHLVMALDEFRALGVDFLSMNDGIDTSTPAGRFTFHVIAAVAELEREIIKERTRAGMQAAKKRGSKIGRPPASVDVEVALTMKREGKSMKEIATVLGVGVSTLYRAMTGLPKGSPDPASGRDRQPLDLQGVGRAA